jgi:molybdopterin-dependent oxidoreductase alpha subunit
MDRYWVPSIVRSALFGTDIADYWYPVAQKGDVAFLYGVVRTLIEKGWCDERFVRDHTTGFEELARAAENIEWSEIERQSGLRRESVEEFAALLGRARHAVLVWSMGLTQHANGADAVRMVLNLGLLRGFIGRERCGLMPIRGHSGVQGGAEMGAYATAFPGGRPVDARHAAELSARYGFPVPDRPGLTATGIVRAAHEGALDALYMLGGNFLQSLPDPAYVEQALERVPLRVHQDIVATDQMLVDPAEEVILLPAQTRYEQEGGGTETTTERRIIFSPQIPRQAGEARAEWRILRDVAARTRPDLAPLLNCNSGPAIREEIAATVPAYAGIETLRNTGDAVQWGGPRLCEGGRFPTADGRAHLAAPSLPVSPPAPGLFRLSTRRGKQFNTMIYGEVDPLTGASRDAVFLSRDDAARLGLRSGDPVLLRSEHGSLRGRAWIVEMAPGDLQVHWPEGNVLLGGGVEDREGGVPDYNALVSIERA